MTGKWQLSHQVINKIWCVGAPTLLHWRTNMSIYVPADMYVPVQMDNSAQNGKEINLELHNYDVKNHTLENLVESAIALMHKQLDYKVMMTEAETGRKVVSITEVVKLQDAYRTYKLTLDNNAVVSVSIKKPYCK